MVVPQRMNKKLQILHLEDDPDFAELVRSLFAQDGLDVELKCAGDRVAFEAALDAGAFDAIVSDYHLPSFSGLEALALSLIHIFGRLSVGFRRWGRGITTVRDWLG